MTVKMEERPAKMQEVIDRFVSYGYKIFDEYVADKKVYMMNSAGSYVTIISSGKVRTGQR